MSLLPIKPIQTVNPRVNGSCGEATQTGFKEKKRKETKDTFTSIVIVAHGGITITVAAWLSCDTPEVLNHSLSKHTAAAAAAARQRGLSPFSSWYNITPELIMSLKELIYSFFVVAASVWILNKPFLTSQGRGGFQLVRHLQWL